MGRAGRGPGRGERAGGGTRRGRGAGGAREGPERRSRGLLSPHPPLPGADPSPPSRSPLPPRRHRCLREALAPGAADPPPPPALPPHPCPRPARGESRSPINKPEDPTRRGAAQRGGRDRDLPGAARRSAPLGAREAPGRGLRPLTASRGWSGLPLAAAPPPPKEALPAPRWGAFPGGPLAPPAPPAGPPRLGDRAGTTKEAARPKEGRPAVPPPGPGPPGLHYASPNPALRAGDCGSPRPRLVQAPARGNPAQASGGPLAPTWLTAPGNGDFLNLPAWRREAHTRVVASWLQRTRRASRCGARVGAHPTDGRTRARGQGPDCGCRRSGTRGPAAQGARRGTGAEAARLSLGSR